MCSFSSATPTGLRRLGIALAIFLATFVSTLSEYGSESAFLKLQEEAARGRMPRAAAEAGSSRSRWPMWWWATWCCCRPGERVPADGDSGVGAGCRWTKSALNGESKEKSKQPGGPGPTEAGLGLSVAQNQLFRGSVVCSGEGVMLVCRVGDSHLLRRHGPGDAGGDPGKPAEAAPRRPGGHPEPSLGYCGGGARGCGRPVQCLCTG